MFLNSMNKNIIKKFLLDQMGVTIAYASNTFLVILFFNLYTQGRVPIRYPILLSGFVYVFFIIAKLYKYIKFDSKVKRAIENPYYDIDAETYEQKEISHAISTIHSKYLNQINFIYEEIDTKNKFFSQWVHNMKTPVSVIDIILQKLMEMDQIDQKLLAEIKEENQKLITNLDQVLNMIRIEDFSKDYVPEVVDLLVSLKKVINESKSQFIYNNVFPSLQSLDRSVKVLSDAKWNEFMIRQIISNAIKYSQAGEESKNIYFKITEEDGYIILTIQDEGVGIPSHDVNRIFEPFFTGENGRKFNESTGIGLYICSVIAEKLGHEIIVQSSKGEGTQIQIKYLSKL